MKKLTIAALAAVLMLNTIPVFAQDTPQDKYICELQAGNCKNRADAIQRKSATTGGRARGTPADNCDAAADNGYVASAAHNTEAFQPRRR